MYKINKEHIENLLNRNDEIGVASVRKAMLVLHNKKDVDGFHRGDWCNGAFYANLVELGYKLGAQHFKNAKKMALKYSDQLVVAAQKKAEDRYFESYRQVNLNAKHSSKIVSNLNEMESIPKTKRSKVA